ncbi:recombination mediator RecR [Candidatus Latescibacterota bacterium]
MEQTGVFDTLVEKLTGLPGIGKKTAQRLAFHIMKIDREEALALSRAIEEVKNRLVTCSTCFNLTEADPCPICADTKRDRSLICVVENPSDLNAIEKAGIYRGIYHVLGSALSPLDNIGPDELRISELERRFEKSVREVIIATNPTVEGEATATYLARLLEPYGVRVSRIARGLPVGSDLELADSVTLARSLEGRLDMLKQAKERE